MELTVLPMAKIVTVTRAMFFRSHKSTVWNRSTSGTPYAVHAFWNLQQWMVPFQSLSCVSKPSAISNFETR